MSTLWTAKLAPVASNVGNRNIGFPEILFDTHT